MPELNSSSPPGSAGRQGNATTATSGSTDHLESEWQFDAGGFEAVVRWLGDLPASGDVRIGPPSTARLRDLYLDTRDWRVFRAGYALRIRSHGRAAEATLKAKTPRDEALIVRREITQPLAAAKPGAIFSGPGPVRDRLSHFCTARHLRVLAEVRTTRRRFPLRFRGTTAGEVTLDRSVLPGVRGPLGRMLRVEIEVPEPLVEEMRPFVDELRAAAGLTASARSKYEWALSAGNLAPIWPPTLGEDRVGAAMTAGEAAYAVLRKQFAAVLWNEPGTRLGEDPEHLHDMRVGTRRMRAALRVFSDALPSRDHARLRRELRALGRSLGAVRDLDVQTERIRSWRNSLITVAPETLDPLLYLLDGRRAAARASLMKHLDSARFQRLIAFLQDWLERGRTAKRPGVSVPVRVVGPRIIRRARKKFMRQSDAIDATAPPAAYHRLRILGKRYRYALEFLEPVYGAPAEALVDALVGVQDILGLHQDAHVSIASLPALAREAHLPQTTRAAVGEIAQLYAAEAARLRELLPAALREVRGKRSKALERAMESASSEPVAECPEPGIPQAAALPAGVPAAQRPTRRPRRARSARSSQRRG